MLIMQPADAINQNESNNYQFHAQNKALYQNYQVGEPPNLVYQR